jgi:hypothetical protein
MAGLDWHPRWSFAAALTRTKLPQFASLVPVLGYAVIWGDQFQNWIMRFDQTLGQSFWLTPLQRIYCLYVGSVIILIGLLLFWAFCPAPIRKHSSRRFYIQAVGQDLDTEEPKRAAAAIDVIEPDANKTVHIHSIALHAGIRTQARGGNFAAYSSPALAAYYEILDRKWWPLSALVLLMLVVGGAVFLVPSLEVFLLAIQHLI